MKVIQTGTIRKLGCSFLFAFHFRDKARYMSKIVIFHTPLAFDAPPPPPLGGPCRNIAIPFGMEKLEC